MKAISAGGVALFLASMLPASARADQPTTVAAVQSRIDFLDNQAEAASEQFNAAQARLTQARQVAQAANGATTRAQVALAAERAKVGVFAGAAYRSGGLGQTAMAATLASGDPGQTLQKIATLQHLSNQQSQVLREANVAEMGYRQALTAATQATATANTVAAGIANQKRHIDALIAQSQQLLNRLSADQRAKLIAAQRAKAAAEQAKASAALAGWRAAHVVRPATRALVRSALRTPHAARAQAQVASLAAPQSGRGSSIADRAVAAAMGKLGSRYVYGAGGARTFDCSGLVQWAYGQAGVRTAHYTGAFWAAYRHVSTSQLRPGDLVFFYSDKHHVGIYIGGGMMVNAPHTGDVVRIAPVFGGGRDYVGAARVVG